MPQGLNSLYQQLQVVLLNWAMQLLLDLYPKLQKRPINLLREKIAFFFYIFYLGFHD